MIIPLKDGKKAWIFLIIIIILIGAIFFIDRIFANNRLERAEDICKVDVCQVYGNDSSLDYVYADTYLCGCFKNGDGWNYKVVHPRTGKITEPVYER